MARESGLEQLLGLRAVTLVEGHDVGEVRIAMANSKLYYSCSTVILMRFSLGALLAIWVQGKIPPPPLKGQISDACLKHISEFVGLCFLQHRCVFLEGKVRKNGIFCQF